MPSNLEGQEIIMNQDDEKKINKWCEFEKSGKISDYLAYIALNDKGNSPAISAVQPQSGEGMIS